MARVRLLNAHGEPVCLHCGAATNAAYAGRGPLLTCWKCGAPLHYHAGTLALAWKLNEAEVPEAEDAP